MNDSIQVSKLLLVKLSCFVDSARVTQVLSYTSSALARAGGMHNLEGNMLHKVILYLFLF